MRANIWAVLTACLILSFSISVGIAQYAPPPPPVSVQMVNTTSSGDLVIQNTDGTTITYHLAPTFCLTTTCQTASQVQTIFNNAFNPAFASAISGLNLATTYDAYGAASSVQTALTNEVNARTSANYLTSVAGLGGNPTVAQMITALGVGTAGLQPVSYFTTPTQAAAAAPVQSVNSKTGVVTLAAADVGAITNSASGVTTALGYTPYNATNPNGYQTLSQVQALSIAIPGGPFTVATLPSCTAANDGRIAFASDLGGGGDNVVCRGTGTPQWAHIRLGTPSTNATCGTITLTPLVSAPVQQLTCTSFPTGSTVNIATSNLYPSEEFYIMTPSTLGGLLSSLGLSLGGVSTGLTLTAGTKNHYIVTSAGALLQLQ